MRAAAPEKEDYFRLRAEWLRFKNHVIDANTELPTLPAVLDDVRRLVEERGTAGLVYIDLGGDPQLEALHGWLAYDDLLRELKRQSFGIAIDDMGAGYSSLHSAVEMEPDHMKFDVSLVRNIDRSLIKRSLLETLVELAEKIGAQAVAEGIEAEPELLAVRDMGVRLGQGRYLAAPAPIPEEGATRA